MDINIENQKEKFKNHIATLTDCGNTKILDFTNPHSNEYHIRFIFEEDYYRLHISGDLGELSACNYYNMTYEKFSDFMNNTGYFREKVECCSRPLVYYDIESAKEELKEYLIEHGIMDDTNSAEGEEAFGELVDEVFYDFSENTGISYAGYEALKDIDSDVFEDVYDLGKKYTPILDVYLLAFRLAKEQLDNKE